MSGHSKWANIKRKKESTDAKKANVFSKLGKEITIAVRDGGPDQSTNSRLRDVISKAKSNNMPNDNIQRCIQKASGEGNASNYEQITYEGFGPCGTAVIVESMTDNKNRAAADIRCIFDRSGGNMGQSGSVSYLFQKKGNMIIEKTNTIFEDDFMMECLEHGAEDFLVEQEYYEIICAPEEYYVLKEYLDSKGYLLADASIKMIPTIKKELTPEEVVKFELFLEKMEENDDVQDVWHNADY